MRTLFLASAGFAVGLSFAVAVPAWADTVRLANGRSMAVDAARFEGDSVVLLMRGGGEIRAPRDLVVEFLPDEVPFAQDAARRALASSPTAAGPRLASETIRTLVDRVARRVGIDERLAHAMVRVESNYEPLAISPRGAMGLMQIMPVVARRYAVRDPYDPEQNLEAGMRYFRQLATRLGLARGLAAYNAGEQAVIRYGGVPPYRETESYVRRVLASTR
jgi:soluble lytic murein transglycosylase-like protein